MLPERMNNDELFPDVIFSYLWEKKWYLDFQQGRPLALPNDHRAAGLKIIRALPVHQLELYKSIIC